MVRILACFASTTTIWIELAEGHVVVVALVSTFAGSFLMIAAYGTVGLARWTRSRCCLRCCRGVRFLRRFVSLVLVLAFLAFAFAF